MNAKDRFYLVVQELGLNDYQLFTKIDGITKNMAYKLRSGLTEEVSTKILTPFLQAYPDVNANYILTGRGSMFLTSDLSQSDSNEAEAAMAKLADEVERLREENEELRKQLAEKARSA